MHIEHLALWTRDLDRLKAIYETYFGASANERYRSKRRPFESYFLTFVTGARLELMSLEGIDEARSETALGYAHLALSTGSREAVARYSSAMVGTQITPTSSMLAHDQREIRRRSTEGAGGAVRGETTRVAN